MAHCDEPSIIFQLSELITSFRESITFILRLLTFNFSAMTDS